MSLRRNLTLAGAAGLLALLLSEATLRLLVPIRLVGPSLTIYDSVYNVGLKKNFRGTQVTPEFHSRVSTNSLGFRGPEPDVFPSGGLLYLGDSFTVGYGVSDGEEFPALVTARLKGTPLGTLPYINAGRGNSGNGHWVKFLRREGERFAPRVVVLQVSDNDIADNVVDGLFTLAPDGSLTELPVPPAGLGRQLQLVFDRIPLVNRSYLFGLVRQAFHSMTGGSARGTAVRDQIDWATTRPSADSLMLGLLSEVGRICQEHGWPAVAVLVGLEAGRDSAIRAVFNDFRIPSASIPSKHARPDLYFVTDGHLNVAGQAFTAEAVVRLLQARIDTKSSGTAARPDSLVHRP